MDAQKLSAEALLGDARTGLEQLTEALSGWRAPADHSARAGLLAGEWDATVQRAYDVAHEPLPAQSEVIGVVNRLTRPQDVVVCAAGSMPGDLHKLWRTRDRKGYHVEYGFSCMGYEIAGGLGVRMAALDAGEDRDVVVMVGDGSYLMLSQELVTAVQEGIKLVVVLVQNHGFASIGALSESLGSQRFGTRYRYRTGTGLDGDVLPVDLAANAASLGARVLSVSDLAGFEKALAEALGPTRPPWFTSRPTLWCPLRTARRGGTSRSPRSRRSTRPAPRARRTTRTRRGSAPTWLPPPHVPRDLPAPRVISRTSPRIAVEKENIYEDPTVVHRGYRGRLAGADQLWLQ
jgi:TPP-dependent trihydroxycyclohexane-1,2-dione (THcHDO) dehydratase